MKPTRGPVHDAIPASLKERTQRIRDPIIMIGLESTTGVSTFDMSTHMFDAQAITCTKSDRMAAEVRVQNEDALPDVPLPKTFATSKRHANITARELSAPWLISLKQADDTIKVTTRNCIRSAVLPLSRRYRADRVFK